MHHYLPGHLLDDQERDLLKKRYGWNNIVKEYEKHLNPGFSLKKSLHIIDNLGLGGAQTVVKTVFEKQRYNDHIFLFALRKAAPEIEVDHKNVNIYPSSSRYSILPLFHLMRLISENNITAVHCHLPRSQAFGFLLKLFFFGRIKLIFHEQGDILENRMLAFLLRVFRYNVDVFIACSRFVKNTLIQKASVPADVIRVIYNCVDRDIFNSKHIKWEIAAERKKLHIGEHDFVVGFAARIIERKGWREFIEAARQLNNMTGLKFMVAGTGVEDEELKKMIRRYNLEDKVIYVGFIPDMVWFYSLLDLFVIPSHWEPMGVTQIEAQAMGMPVIASNVDGLNEVVDSDNVMFFEAGNTKELSDLILRLMEDSTARTLLTAAGKRNAEKYYADDFILKLNSAVQNNVPASSMKYLFLSSIVWDGYLGHNQELPLALAKKGHTCTYLNPIRYRNWEKHSTRLHSLSDNKKGGVKVLERYSRIPKSFLLLIYENFLNIFYIRNHKPDVVVSFDYLMGVLPCIYCRLSKIKFIYSVMDDWEEIETNPLMKLYLKYISKPVMGKFSYAISSTSHKQAAVFRKFNKNVFLVPNGKPNDFIENAHLFLDEIKKETKTVNFISTLRDWYDYDMLFEIFGEFPEIQLNIYGKGDLYSYVLDRASDYPNIAVKGNAEAKAVPRLTAESLFGILPLKLNKLNDSTSPIKLFDYWSARKAVIASPTYELRELGKQGGIIYASSKEEYVTAIKNILRDDALMNSVGETGYAHVMEQYNYESIAKRFEKITT